MRDQKYLGIVQYNLQSKKYSPCSKKWHRRDKQMNKVLSRALSAPCNRWVSDGLVCVRIPGWIDVIAFMFIVGIRFWHPDLKGDWTDLNGLILRLMLATLQYIMYVKSMYIHVWTTDMIHVATCSFIEWTKGSYTINDNIIFVTRSELLISALIC